MNKIVIAQNETGRWYAVLKSSNGNIVWQTPGKGVKHKKSVKKVIKCLQKPFKVVEEVITSNIVR